MAKTDISKSVFLVLTMGFCISLMAMTLNLTIFPGGDTGASQEVKGTSEIANASTNATKILGNPIYEENTTSTGIRVLDVSHGPKIEISFAGNGTINGTTPVTDIGTIWTLPTSPDDMSLYSEGQGILTTEQGAMVTYTQQAAGEITSEGRVIFSGSMFFRALPSQTGELDFLNNLVGVYDYESDLAGNAERVVWEWKP